MQHKHFSQLYSRGIECSDSLSRKHITGLVLCARYCTIHCW